MYDATKYTPEKLKAFSDDVLPDGMVVEQIGDEMLVLLSEGRHCIVEGCVSLRDVVLHASQYLLIESHEVVERAKCRSEELRKQAQEMFLVQEALGHTDESYYNTDDHDGFLETGKVRE